MNFIKLFSLLYLQLEGGQDEGWLVGRSCWEAVGPRVGCIWECRGDTNCRKPKRKREGGWEKKCEFPLHLPPLLLG